MPNKPQSACMHARSWMGEDIDPCWDEVSACAAASIPGSAAGSCGYVMGQKQRRHAMRPNMAALRPCRSSFHI